MGLSRNVQRALVKRGDPVQADNWRQRMVDVVDSRRHGQGDLLRSCPAGNVLCPMGNDSSTSGAFKLCGLHQRDDRSGRSLTSSVRYRTQIGAIRAAQVHPAAR